MSDPRIELVAQARGEHNGCVIDLPGGRESFAWRCVCGSGRDVSAPTDWETAADELRAHENRAVLTALADSFAAERAEGVAWAIAALREQDAQQIAAITNSEGRVDWDSYDSWADTAADHLESLAASPATTGEAGQ
jgi:hypothetical protein